MPIVEVPDLGVIEFPDDMSEEDMDSAIRSQLAQPQQPSFSRMPAEATLPEALAQPMARTSQWSGGAVRTPFPGSLQPEQMFDQSPASAGVPIEANMPGAAGPMEFISPGDSIPPAGQIQQPQDKPWMASPRILDQLPEALLGLSDEARERQRQVQAGQAKVSQNDALRIIKEANSQYEADLESLSSLGARDPNQARSIAAQLNEQRKEKIRNAGVAPLESFARATLGEQMTPQMEKDLFGDSSVGRRIGTFQRTAQGLAEAFVQPEMMPMAPGVVAAERALMPAAEKLAMRLAGRHTGMQTTGKMIGEAFLPQMAGGAAAEFGAAGGHISAGDWEAGFDSGISGTATALLTAMPIYAIKRGNQARWKAYVERLPDYTTRLNAVEVKLADPSIPEAQRGQLLAERADLQQGADLLKTMEDNMVSEGDGTGRQIEFTDRSLGKSAKPP